ncbi:MAG TPA: hypothetical protein VHK69_11595, partial [Chitinophagaceae bacterium]|nr:hypothetical protein [Chitinophagaceae bacterium]
MRRIFSACLLFSALSATNQLNAQGCVAIRGTGTVCTKMDHIEEASSGWQFNAGYRYFKSFRH